MQIRILFVEDHRGVHFVGHIWSLKDLHLFTCGYEEKLRVRGETKGGHWSLEVEVGNNNLLLKVDDKGESINIDGDQGLSIRRKLHSCDV